MDDADITRVLAELQAEGPAAAERAWEVLYPEMLRLAKAERRRWGGNWTLETRVLANEAYLKLFGEEVRSYQDRRHFFNLVSRAIRQILVNYATSRRRQKRGGEASTALPLHEVDDRVMSAEVAEEVLDLNEALDRFRKIDPRATEVVELKFFAGLTGEEIGEAMGLSPATVGRDWVTARAWLSRELGSF
jgi:RNA polymerase sigma factor (TIGR02999 family)